MPRPALKYPVDPGLLSGFLALSPWSQTEMAKRFGVGRANWVGLLHGRRTIGEPRFRDLLRWVGLQVQDGELCRLPGLVVWRIASAQHVEAFRNLPATLQPKDTWDLVVSSPVPDRDWVHLLVQKAEKFPLLLSVRPQWYPFLQTFQPGLLRHHRLWCFDQAVGIEKIHAVLGENQPAVPLETGNRWFVARETAELREPDLEEWARWMRQILHVDTSAWLLPGLVENEGGKVQEKDASDDPQVSGKIWTYLSHRLDLGDTHASVCSIPVFSLETPGNVPLGMVRLDTAFLGEEAVETGRRHRLAFYRDDHSGVLWLIRLRDPAGCADSAQPTSGRPQSLGLLRREAVLGILAGSPEFLALGNVVGCFKSRGEMERCREELAEPE